MRFARVCTYFDRDKVYDAYTGDFLWKAQTSSYQDTTSDGATLRRRTMSFAPGLVLPDRRALRLPGNEVWLAGAGSHDSWNGIPVRQSSILKQADGQYSYASPAVALTSSFPDICYGQKMYFRDVSNGQTDSNIETFWNIFVAPSESIAEGSIIRGDDGQWFRVRQAYLPIEGLRVLQSDALEGDRVACTFLTGDRDPVTEVATGSATVWGLVMDTQVFFEVRQAAEYDNQPGDKALLVGQDGVTPKPNMPVSIAGVPYRVVSVVPELDAWVCKVRL